MDRRTFLAGAAAGAAIPVIGAPCFAAGETGPVSGPYSYANLAVYILRGPSLPGPVPRTLQEALADGTVIVRETGDVSSLEIENRGDADVFVQAGDIVRGGKQDRALNVSLLLPRHGAPIPIDVFCVERGRWQGRGRESAARFASSDAMLPSRAAKLAMQAPPPDIILQLTEGGRRQGRVWRDVAETQSRLARTVGASVSSPVSRTSLLLSLENAQVRAAVAAYVEALSGAAARAADSVGLAFAINGDINSVDIYHSHGLFLKLWPKLLEAAATEAVADRTGKAATPPAVIDLASFMAEAEQGVAGARMVSPRDQLVTRTSDEAYYLETRAGGTWLHRRYLAR